MKAEKCGVCGTEAPKQTSVRHRDGDTQNVDAANLEIVVTAEHPFVAVGRPNHEAIVRHAMAQSLEAKDDGDAMAKRIADAVKGAPVVGAPCCARCQAAPPAGLKVHFFPRAMAPKAMRLADSGTLGLPGLASTAVAHAPGDVGEQQD